MAKITKKKRIRAKSRAKSAASTAAAPAADSSTDVLPPDVGMENGLSAQNEERNAINHPNTNYLPFTNNQNAANPPP